MRSHSGSTPQRANPKRHVWVKRQSRWLWHDWRLCCVSPKGEHRTDGDAFVSYENPDYWRRRAEETRTRAEHMLDGITKGLMLEVAESYERIAKAYEAPRRTKEG